MQVSDESLRGRTVISADGQVIGAVAALVIDPATWHVDAIKIELRKTVADDIGANRTMFHRGTIELPVALVQSVGDAVVLAASVDRLREVQQHTRQSAPAPAQ